YFEQALAGCNHPRQLCNWLIVEFAGRFKDTGKSLISSGIPAEHVGKLVHMISNKTITGRIAKSVADDMVASPDKDPETIVSENPDYQPMDDHAALEAIVDQILSEHAQSVTDFKNGKEKAFSFLIGQIMKATRGKASPELVNQLLRAKISN